jgi:hypothetical protein
MSEENEIDDEEAFERLKRPSKNGLYGLVGLMEGDESTDVSNTEQPRTLDPKSTAIWNRNWIPDHWYGTHNVVHVLDGVQALRLLKFILITLLGIVGFFHLARFMDWEHDANYSLQDLLLYDFGNIILDIIVFFLIGRLYQKRGVDHLGWTGTMWMACIYTSCSYTFGFLQHSVSLYDMHCHWPLALWLYLAATLAISAFLIYQHVQYVRLHHTLTIKLVEILFAALIWLAPQMAHPNFHFHHWFAGWLVGMHMNADTWWSRAAMAWCWGQYINGVSTWGRDPQLTCAYAYYMSVDQYCPYMKCFQELVTIHGLNNETMNHTVYKALPEPDWRNCSAAGNYNP